MYWFLQLLPICKKTAEVITSIADKIQEKVVEQKDPVVEKKEEKIPPQNAEPVVASVQKPVEKETEKKASEVVAEKKTSQGPNVSFDFSRPDLGVSNLDVIPLTPKAQHLDNSPM